MKDDTQENKLTVKVVIDYISIAALKESETGTATALPGDPGSLLPGDPSNIAAGGSASGIQAGEVDTGAKPGEEGSDFVFGGNYYGEDDDAPDEDEYGVKAGETELTPEEKAHINKKTDATMDLLDDALGGLSDLADPSGEGDIADGNSTAAGNDTASADTEDPLAGDGAANQTEAEASSNDTSAETGTAAASEPAPQNDTAAA